MRRHRIGVSFGGLALLVLIAFAVTMTLQAGRIARERDRAEAKQLLALARIEMADDPSAAIAYVIASLERADDPETRRLAVEAMWRGPIRTQLPTGWGYGVGFSPDGQWLAASNTTNVWSADGAPVQLDAVPDELTMELGFGPQSTHLAIVLGAGRERIGIWSVPEGRLLRTLEFGTATISWFLARDTTRLVSAALDLQSWGTSLWKEWPLDGGPSRTLGRLETAPGSVWIRPDIDSSGNWIAYADDRDVRLVRLDRLDTSSGTVVASHDESVSALTFHPDGDQIASVGRSGEIRIRSRLAGPESVSRVLAGQMDVMNLRFDNTGRKLVTVGMGAQLWDLNSPPDADPIVLDSRPVDIPAVSFHPSGYWVATVGSNVNVWPATRRFPQVLRGQPGKEALDIEFSTDGNWIASASADGTVRTWPLTRDAGSRNRVVFETQGDFVEPTRVAIDPGGRYLATSTLGGEVRVLPLDGKPQRRLSGFNGVLHSIAVGPRGRFVASGGGGYGRVDEAIVRVWDLESGEVRVLDAGDGEHITCLLFTPEGGLLSASGSGLRLWDIHAGTHRLVREGQVQSLALSHDGLLLTAGDREAQVSVSDLASGNVRTLSSHGNHAEVVAVSADGKVVASTGPDGMIRVGSVTGEEPHLLIGHRGPVQALAFSPDGRRLASAGNDGTIRLWPVPNGTPLHTLPYHEFLALLRKLTNLRAVAEEQSSGGYAIRPGAFPGWRTMPDY
jgi:WD40 repeat protein